MKRFILDWMSDSYYIRTQRFEKVAYEEATCDHDGDQK